MAAPPARPRGLRALGKLTAPLITFALALAGTTVAAGTGHAADQHPAAAGWVRTHGSWVQVQPGHPHAAADALTTMTARSTATVSQHPAHPMGLVNNDQPDLTYRGGQDSVGVTSGSPKVYIIYWGSQWGTAGKDSAGYTTLSNDPENAAPYQQSFFRGLGTKGDAWSGVMTQYCESVSTGSTKCAANSPHVGIPHGDALAGVWVDNSTAAPQAATEPQIAAEAAAAAKHFGNTTPASNRNVQYVVTTAQGMDPDHWHELNTWCAWHTFERSSYGTVAYTLMPYLTDYKYCGTNWINPGPRGRLDGWSILGGHEYAETITDQNAIGGWIDAAGQEDGDKCAWINQGTPGGLFNLQLTTGAFAVQTTWSNDQHTCSGSHPVVANHPLVVSTLCDRTEPVNRPVSVPVIATDRLSKALRYSATGLPRGLSIDARTGLIHGRSNQRGTRAVAVTVRDKAGNRAAAHFRLGILPSAEYGCQGIEQIVDPGFEVAADAKGNYPGWWAQSAPGIITQSTAHAAHSGKGYAWLGHSATQDDTLSQSVETTPGYTKASFSFWLHVDSTNTSAQSQGTLTLELDDQYSGKRIAVLHTWSNLDATSGYVPVSVDLTPYVAPEFGSTVIVKFTSHETGNAATAFLLDDTSFRLA
ncbi:Ig domain-containing protein [Streptomyces sp. RPT161]|uniref:Ig domain-containing protein n=1 Tax=Streptomyces sp. RPT161 TaxID=3015993 RepID=UPI0022B8AE02|nr:Ig domain-containing protein [Streptomyces sp. RPT161]